MILNKIRICRSILFKESLPCTLSADLHVNSCVHMQMFKNRSIPLLDSDCATDLFITFLFAYHVLGFNHRPALFLHWPHLLWKINLTYAISSDSVLMNHQFGSFYFFSNIHLIKEQSRIKSLIIVAVATLLACTGRCLTWILITHFALIVCKRSPCFFVSFWQRHAESRKRVSCQHQNHNWKYYCFD